VSGGHLRRFPNTNDGKWIVSTAGGRSSVWTPDGRELFYMTGATLMVVPVRRRAADFAAGTPVGLPSGPFDAMQAKNFDVFPDGKRFLTTAPPQEATKELPITVVLNWPAILEQ
jgi:hypothetical protein